MGRGGIGTLSCLALVAEQYLGGYSCGPYCILLGTLSVGLGIPSPHVIL